MEKDIEGCTESSDTVHVVCTPSAVAKSTFFYIHEAGLARCGEKAIFREKDGFLLGAVIKGRGELELSGETFQLTKGDCLFIDLRLPCCISSSDGDPWDIIWVRFNGATSAQYYSYHLSRSGNVFRTSALDKLVSVIAEIIDTNRCGSPDAEIMTSGLIARLLTDVLISDSSDEQTDSALRQKLASVNTYIEEHFAEEITLEKLSSSFYISKYYLTREYKKIYGKTIFQHIINCRINCGKKLLRFSDRSVEEIAHLCGFNDQSYFARQFKKSENVTCFAYRKKWRE